MSMWEEITNSFRDMCVELGGHFSFKEESDVKWRSVKSEEL